MRHAKVHASDRGRTVRFAIDATYASRMRRSAHVCTARVRASASLAFESPHPPGEGPLRAAETRAGGERARTTSLPAQTRPCWVLTSAAFPASTLGASNLPSACQVVRWLDRSLGLGTVQALHPRTTGECSPCTDTATRCPAAPPSTTPNRPGGHHRHGDRARWRPHDGSSKPSAIGRRVSAHHRPEHPYRAGRRRTSGTPDDLYEAFGRSRAVRDPGQLRRPVGAGAAWSDPNQVTGEKPRLPRRHQTDPERPPPAASANTGSRKHARPRPSTSVAAVMHAGVDGPGCGKPCARSVASPSQHDLCWPPC